MPDKKALMIRIILSIFIFMILGYLSLFVMVGFSIASLHAGFYIKMIFLALGGVAISFIAWCAQSRRLKIAGRCIIAAALAGILLGNFYFWWTVDRFGVVAPAIRHWEYTPFSKDNKLVLVTAAPEQRIEAPVPKVDGAYAFYPVYAAAVQAVYPSDFKPRDVKTNGSDTTFKRLIDGDVDLIFSLAPSKRQLQDAVEKNITYEMTPFAREAFVFFVNRQNPVENLTSEEVRGIYSGAITDWKALGAPKSAKIRPFQRNEGSGSQTALQTIMGDTPIIPPLEADRLRGMGGIIRDTADYRNYRESIGFSFRYYVEGMTANPEIKLLSIDGIAPTRENIANGTYPFIFTSYIITARPRSENTQKFIDFMLSPQGREIIEKTGYTPLQQ